MCQLYQVVRRRKKITNAIDVYRNLENEHLFEREQIMKTKRTRSICQQFSFVDNKNE